MNIFPAAPDTMLLSFDFNSIKAAVPGITRTPVIGWQHIQGHIAFPITVVNHGGMTHGNAIRHGIGYVSDPVHRLVFESEAEWANFMRTAKPKVVTPTQRPVDEEEYEPATPEPPKAAVRASEPARDETITFHKDTAGAGLFDRSASPRIPNKPKGRPQVFKSKSFWKFVHERHVFVVEGGVEAPAKNDPDYEKITREEMLELQRKSHTKLEWPLVDDDGMDLV